MKRIALAMGTAAALGLAMPGVAQAPAAAGVASNWEIGPIIRGRNYSQGAALNPTPLPGGAWGFSIPRAPGSVHYVTFRGGSLAGKSRIVMRYRIEAAPGVEIRPITGPQGPAILTLYFQRGADDWSGRGPFEAYRWYATFASVQPLMPGEHTIVAPLSGNWTAVQSSSARTNPQGFAAAKAQADRVGFVLGGGDGYGHGVFATGPARFVMLDYRIE